MKKLSLKKTTIVNLNDDEMNNIRGATFFQHSCDCQDTKSCSFYQQCCPPPEGLGIEEETILC